MIPKILSEEIHLEDGRKIIIETGNSQNKQTAPLLLKWVNVCF